MTVAAAEINFVGTTRVTRSQPWPNPIADNSKSFIDTAGARVDLSGDDDLTIVVESQTLLRDCLVKCLLAADLRGKLHAFSSVAAYVEAPTPHNSRPLILLHVPHGISSAEFDADIDRLDQMSDQRPMIVVLAEDEDARLVQATLDKGIRGYIPTSLPLGVAVEVMRLVRAGGVFAPAGALSSWRSEASHVEAQGSAMPHGLFTSRQGAVIEALRQGKSNKVIAYDLEMCESTVKVHIRNIMRKLKARNRTEVAFLISQMAETRGYAPPPRLNAQALRP